MNKTWIGNEQEAKRKEIGNLCLLSCKEIIPEKMDHFIYYPMYYPFLITSKHYTFSENSQMSVLDVQCEEQTLHGTILYAMSLTFSKLTLGFFHHPTTPCNPPRVGELENVVPPKMSWKKSWWWLLLGVSMTKYTLKMGDGVVLVSDRLYI